MPVLPGCKDQVRDDFPRSRFIGHFNLMDPRYSQSVFMATYDMDRNTLGISGIIVYRMGDPVYAFDQMCPYEKRPTCLVSVDIENDPTIAECKCCGSRFLIASETGSLIEGPATRGLQTYHAKEDWPYLVITSY